jgi:hypothetical protein
MVDARVAHEYVEERIKGAVSIPYKEHSQTHIDFDPERDIFDLASGRDSGVEGPAISPGTARSTRYLR